MVALKVRVVVVVVVVVVVSVIFCAVVVLAACLFGNSFFVSGSHVQELKSRAGEIDCKKLGKKTRIQLNPMNHENQNARHLSMPTPPNEIRSY